ncbi:glutamyl-tRNA(Gln) amidotransferase subunit A, mitochondrial-like [Convolutriloba macropyga]|uniref:glutamyl-tRNA(Gln) amidotransferase subunit A, mitochondrial-like n=1 Tax=Convolutriloba macropyga TaxID=536237 RepID=UPI003F52418A
MRSRLKAIKSFLPGKVIKNIKALSFLNAITHINANFDSNYSPYLIKDNFAVKGMPLSCASAALRNLVSPYDATVVSRLRNNGYDAIGRTNMDEFAMGSGSVDSVYGPVVNPWTVLNVNNERRSDDFIITGGSSGGSAAAVAADLVPFAIGSDTGGSIRLPAAFCGVLGFKPSYGAVSRHGLVSLANAFDTPGIFSRSAHILKDVFESLVSKGSCIYDSTSDVSILSRGSENVSTRTVRIGIPDEYYVHGLSSEICDVWEFFAAEMKEKLNWEIVRCSLPSTRHVIPCYSVLVAADVASNMARYDGIEFGSRIDDVENYAMGSSPNIYKETRTKFLGDTVKGRILLGNYFSLKSNLDKFYITALKVRKLVFEDFQKCFESNNLDALLTPVSLDVAPWYSDFVQKDMREQSELQDVLTCAANLAGIPACSFPVKMSQKQTLPISLQLMGPFGSDLKLLNIVKRVSEMTSFDYSELDSTIQTFL